jgi:hypothetical protein
MKRYNGSNIKRHNDSKLTPVGRLYKQKGMVRRSVVEFVEVYIFIYNGLNESSFYQVGACLQVESCMQIGFPTSQLDLRSTSWDFL